MEHGSNTDKQGQQIDNRAFELTFVRPKAKFHAVLSVFHPWLAPPGERADKQRPMQAQAGRPKIKQRPAWGLRLQFPRFRASCSLVAFGNGSKEATIMPHVWPSEPLIRLELDVVDRACSVCGRKMHVCDHRKRPIYTLEGPRLLINRLVRCPDVLCAGRRRTVSPEAEAAIALPQSIIGWDLFCWIGHRSTDCSRRKATRRCTSCGSCR